MYDVNLHATSFQQIHKILTSLTRPLFNFKFPLGIELAGWWELSQGKNFQISLFLGNLSLSLLLFLFLSPSEIWSSLFIIISHHYGYLISFYFLKISQGNTSTLFLFHLSLPIRLSHCHCHHKNFGFWPWMWATQVINLLIILLDKFEVF